MPEEARGPRLRPEELGVSLVREAKFDVLGPDLAAEDALALEKQVEHMDSLIQEERIKEADEIAEDCLSRVLRFPEHRPVLLRKWWVLPLVIVVLIAMIVCALCLII